MVRRAATIIIHMKALAWLKGVKVGRGESVDEGQEAEG